MNLKPTALVLMLVSCVGPDHSVEELVTPDAFHLAYTYGGGDYSGTSATGGSLPPYRRYGVDSGDSDYTAWTAGLTWYLSAPSGAGELRRAARAMQISARLMADAAHASMHAPDLDTGEPLELRLPAALEAAILARVSQPSPEIETQPAPSCGPVAAPDLSADEGPRGVELLGVSSEVWTQLVIAMTIIATAVGGYLGRDRIPGVRQVAQKIKAARAGRE